MVARGPLLAAVERRLADRRLVWAGIRGDDIEPLSDLPQLYASFSIAGNYVNRGNVHSVAYEDMTGIRVDPEIWDIDEQLHEPATKEFRHGLLRALSSDSALLPYRPSPFLSAVHFARLEAVSTWGYLVPNNPPLSTSLGSSRPFGTWTCRESRGHTSPTRSSSTRAT